MTTITAFITGYFAGMTVMALIAWWIHNKYCRAHQKEYRRLCSGIVRAKAELATPGKMNCKAANILTATLIGDR